MDSLNSNLRFDPRFEPLQVTDMNPPPRVWYIWLLSLILTMCLVGCGEGRKTPLTAAITGDLGLLKRLDAEGADLNVQYADHFHWTPLMAAIYFQNDGISRYLIERRVDVRKRDSNGNTALMWAIRVGDSNTAALLVQKAGVALRQGEDWPRVWSLIRATDQPGIWRAILDPIGRESASRK